MTFVAQMTTFLQYLIRSLNVFMTIMKQYSCTDECESEHVDLRIVEARPEISNYDFEL